jgi:hypothetical protein
MSMRKLLSVVCFFIACNAWAAPASPESVEELLRVTRAGAMVESVYGNMEQIMRQGALQGMQGKPMTPEQQRVLDTMIPRMIAVMRQEFNWETLRPQYIQLYRETFEQEEVDGLIAFYKSPAGQAFVDKMPVVLQKSIAMSQSMMRTTMPRIMAELKDAMAEAKAAK